MKLIMSFIMALLFASTLSANCGKANCDMQMKNEHCKMKEHKSQMKNCDMKKDCKKKNCDMHKNCKMKENKNCDMKKKGSCGQGKCGSNMKSGSCGQGKCGSNMKSDSAMKAGSCGAGKCGASMKMKAKCDCKNGGECKCKASGKECKCSKASDKKEVKMCGCGMTQESCERMMPECEHRDARKAKEAKK